MQQNFTNHEPSPPGVPTPLAAQNPSISGDWTRYYAQHLDAAKGFIRFDGSPDSTDIKLDLRAMQTSGRRPTKKASSGLLSQARREPDFISAYQRGPQDAKGRNP